MKKNVVLIAALLMVTSPTYAQVTLGTSASSTNPQRSGDATTGLFSPASGDVAVSSAGTEVMRVTGTGVGIGGINPAQQLEVSQGVNSSTIVRFTNTMGTGGGVQMQLVGSSGTSPSSQGTYVGDFNALQLDGTPLGDFVVEAGSAVGRGQLSLNTNGGSGITHRVIITENGNLGLGTRVPDALLSFDGQSAQTIDLVRETTSSTAGSNLTVQAGGAVSGGSNLGGGSLILSSGISTGNNSSNVQVQTYPAGSSGTADNSALTSLTISATGTTGSNAATTVQANAGSGTNKNGGTLTLASGVSTGTGTSGINFNVYGAGSSGSTPNSATTAMTITSGGNVGIGTTNPQAALDIESSTANEQFYYGSVAPALRLANTNTGSRAD